MVLVMDVVRIVMNVMGSVEVKKSRLLRNANSVSVDAERRRMSESFPTLSAKIRPLTRVSSHMSFNIVLSRANVRAVVTAKTAINCFRIMKCSSRGQTTAAVGAIA